MRTTPTELVTKLNRFGAALVWPHLNGDGQTQIRCLLPGAAI